MTAQETPGQAADTPGSGARPDNSAAGQGDIGNRQNGQHAASISDAELEAAAEAIHSAQNANDDEPERWEANHLARVALEAARAVAAPGVEITRMAAANSIRKLREENGQLRAQLAAQEPKPAPELPCSICEETGSAHGVPQDTPVGTAWQLLDETRAKLAVTAAERDRLSTELDKLKELLDLATSALALASPEDADTAAVIRSDAGLPVIDQFSKLEDT